MRATLAVLVILALGMPGAMAGWNAKGGHEPDTLRDATDRWMFRDPDTSLDARKVYFNGWEGHGSMSAIGAPGVLTITLEQSSFDPNVGAAQTSLAGQDYAFYAMMGVWKDCNGDGYVGFGEQGLFEYRAELLIPFTGNPCPAVTTARPYPRDWFPSHNDGQWVREMLPIGWSFSGNGIGGTNDLNPYNINDNGSRVWLDYGYPEDPQAPPGCQVNPAQMGTFHTTGGMLSWADCASGYFGTQLVDAAVDSAGHPEYSFEDHPRDAQNSASELNRPNPWGTSQDAGDVEVWDCGAPRLVQQSQYVEGYPGVLSSRTYYVNVTAVRPVPFVRTDGSPAGTMHALEQSSSCGPSNAGNELYILEGDVVQRTARVSPTAYLHPIEITRPVAPYAVALGHATPPGPGDGDTGQGDLGLGLTTQNDFWTDYVDRRAEGPLVDVRSASFSPPQRVSYYGFVSPAAISQYALDMPNPGATGSYLAEACAGSYQVRNGWDCDPSHWWHTPSGIETQPRVRYLGHEIGNPAGCTPVIASNAFDYTAPSTTSGASRGCVSIAPFPGAPYDLRDLDCYDQSAMGLRDVQLSWGLLTGTYCVPPPS